MIKRRVSIISFIVRKIIRYRIGEFLFNLPILNRIRKKYAPTIDEMRLDIIRKEKSPNTAVRRLLDFDRIVRKTTMVDEL